MKKKIGLIIVIVVLFFSYKFHSELFYLSELAKTIYKIQRTEADITDYKYFNNIEIPKSKNPQSWPIHENYNKASLTTNLKSIHKKFGTVAFLIIKNDSIWHEKYYNGYNKSSYSNSFSMSKSIVNAIMGRAIQEGYFNSLDDKVSSFIDGYNKYGSWVSSLSTYE